MIIEMMKLINLNILHHDGKIHNKIGRLDQKIICFLLDEKVEKKNVYTEKKITP